MSNVDLINSNQSQSKPEMDTLLKNIKNSKRKILKLLQKFEDREAQGYEQEDIQIILTSIIDINNRLRKFENNVENLHKFIINDWEEDNDEEIDKLIEKLTSDSVKYSEYVWEFTIRSREIIHHIESAAHENKFYLTNILEVGKETNTFNNLIKLNNNGTNVNIDVLPELDDESENNTDTNILEIFPESSDST